ncbi:MAG TPA: cytochrome c [Burkholderiales bacterium]|nr:cytochrome c [Burkholderiales bacterium]
MNRLALAILLLAPLSAPAQAYLNERQLLGLRLYNQSCRVCHTKPQLTSPQYAPLLSRASLNGSNEALFTYIANGSARMPGFKYQYQPYEIDALVAYLKTIPSPE